MKTENLNKKATNNTEKATTAPALNKMKTGTKYAVKVPGTNYYQTFTAYTCYIRGRW